MASPLRGRGPDGASPGQDGLFPVWLRWCRARSWPRAKSIPHSMHRCRFGLSCPLRWLSSLSGRAKLFSQSAHQWGFSPEWMCWYRARAERLEKLFPHLAHWGALEWTWWWAARLLGLPKLFPQSAQLLGLSPACARARKAKRVWRSRNFPHTRPGQDLSRHVAVAGSCFSPKPSPPPGFGHCPSCRGSFPSSVTVSFRPWHGWGSILSPFSGQAGARTLLTTTVPLGARGRACSRSSWPCSGLGDGFPKEVLSCSGAPGPSLRGSAFLRVLEPARGRREYMGQPQKSKPRCSLVLAGSSPDTREEREGRVRGPQPLPTDLHSHKAAGKPPGLRP